MRPDHALNSLPLPALFERLAASGLMDRLIALAVDEDLGTGEKSSDITTDCCVPPEARARASLVARAPGVIAGLAVLPRLLQAMTTSVRAEVRVQDGDPAQANQTIATLAGPLDEILTLERTLLNIVGRLSGIATITRRYANAVAHTRAKVCDTRKTTPGMRVLEKYAVRCGGGVCHRIGLFDAVLIKDNHLAGVQNERLAGVVFEMLNGVSSLRPTPSFVEVEAANLAQMRELCKVVGIDVILLDNFSVPQLAEAVQYRNELGLRGKLELEASGGVTLQTVRAIAETGVERISVGAITHSATAVDLSLERL